VNPRSIRLHQYAGFIALALAACSGGRAVNHNMTDMPSAHGSMAASTAAIDALLAPYSSPNVPGASVVVLRGGEVVYERAFGGADLEAHTAATVHTDYRLASLTKAFTAMSIMLLVKEGKLHYDDRVIDVLPGFPEYARDIHIRHLLAHTSGIVDYEDFVPDSQTTQLNDDDVLELVHRTDTLNFAPGFAYHYSNSAYVLLGLIVALALHRAFDTPLQLDRLKTRAEEPGRRAFKQPFEEPLDGGEGRHGRWRSLPEGPADPPVSMPSESVSANCQVNLSVSTDGDDHDDSARSAAGQGAHQDPHG